MDPRRRHVARRRVPRRRRLAARRGRPPRPARPGLAPSPLPLEPARGDPRLHTVILAGGLGTRLMEETDVRPKPMVEIGGRPILTHIMRHYARHGLHDFIVALGYKGEVIKDYFLNYHALSGSMSVDLATGS